jgi:hypothetical protein
MAKNKSGLFRISGTIGGITYVHTTDGGVVRAARGTYKEAVLNDDCKAQVNRNTIVNGAAKLVHDVVRVYAGIFKYAKLWQDMLKRVRKCVSDDLAALLETLEGLEINPKYTLPKILVAGDVTVQYGSGMMTVAVKYHPELNFEIAGTVDSYYLEFCVIFIDEDRVRIESAMINSGWRKNGGKDARFETSFEIPPLTKHYVVILKVQGGVDEQEVEDKRAMGMQVVKTGVVG